MTAQVAVPCSGRIPRSLTHTYAEEMVEVGPLSHEVNTQDWEAEIGDGEGGVVG